MSSHTGTDSPLVVPSKYTKQLLEAKSIVDTARDKLMLETFSFKGFAELDARYQQLCKSMHKVYLQDEDCTEACTLLGHHQVLCKVRYGETTLYAIACATLAA
jgi:hypothetical protein